MSDISMCGNGDKCPDRQTCYRWRAHPSEWQSYADFYEPTNPVCQYWWSIAGRRIQGDP